MAGHRKKYQEVFLKRKALSIAMLSIHSSPKGDLGTRDTGGMSVYVRELAAELGCQGHNVDIYTQLHDPAQPPVTELAEKARLISLSIGNTVTMPKQVLYPHIEKFFQALEAFRRAEHLHYDVIHSHYWLSGCLGMLAQEQWNVPHIIMFHTLGAIKNTTGVGEQEPDLRIALETVLTRKCSRILVAAEREKQHIIRTYHGAPEKTSVIPCGVNLTRFQPVNKREARKQLGFSQEESLLLYVGRFDPLKGIDRLLAAMTYLKHYPRLRLVIIGGNDNHEPEARRLGLLVKKLGLEESVLFAGRIDQDRLPAYYSAADVVVIPSCYESFGLVVLEALACGTPVVATPVGAMECILSKPGLGLVVKDTSARSLAVGIEAFLQDVYRQGMTPKTIRSYALPYGWTPVAAAVLNEYREVIRRHRYGDSSILPRRYAKVPLHEGAMHQPVFFS